MLRQEVPPSKDAWAHLRSLFTGDDAFEVSNELLTLAIAIEKKADRQQKAVSE